LGFTVKDAQRKELPMIQTRGVKEGQGSGWKDCLDAVTKKFGILIVRDKKEGG